MLRIRSSISSSFSLGKGSSKFLEKSLSVVWLTRDVILVLLFAVSSATTSFVEAIIEQLVPSLLGNLDANDLLRQVNELENSLLANVYRQLENLFGLSGSRRNLSLHHNRFINNFVSALNLRHHLIVHFSDGSVVFVHFRSKTASEDCSTNGRISFLYFRPPDSRIDVSLVSTAVFAQA